MRDATAKAIVCARQIGAVIDRDNGPVCSCAAKKTFADLASGDSELSVKATIFRLSAATSSTGFGGARTD